MAHVHQYKKVKLSKKFVYRCMLADCSHYVLPAMILGKKSLCPSCGSTFVIDKYASQRAHPVCQDCRKTKESSPESSRALTNTVADILTKLQG